MDAMYMTIDQLEHIPSYERHAKHNDICSTLLHLCSEYNSYDIHSNLYPPNEILKNRNRIRFAFINHELPEIQEIYGGGKVGYNFGSLWVSTKPAHSEHLNSPPNKFVWMIQLPEKEKNPIDLVNLESFLRNGDFKLADRETTYILLRFSRDDMKWLKPDEIAALPIELLYEVDQLWMLYSDRRFGISPQYEIWLSEKNEKNVRSHRLFRSFSNRIGWAIGDSYIMQYDKMKFNLNAPKGHLPTFRFAEAQVTMGASWYDNWESTYKNIVNRIDSFFHHSP